MGDGGLDCHGLALALDVIVHFLTQELYIICCECARGHKLRNITILLLVPSLCVDGQLPGDVLWRLLAGFEKHWS